MTDRTLIIVSRVAQSGNKLNREMVGAPRLWQGPPTEEWLVSRSKLLENVTVPSLHKITVPFHWIWRVHPDRRDQAQEIADRLWPTAILVDEEHTHPDIPGDKFTGIRLDADDALSASAVELLFHSDLGPSTLVSWQEGWKYRPDTGEVAEWAWGHKTQGPFLAVTLDDRDEMLDVPGPHNPARIGRDTITLQPGRSWLYTMHGDNVRGKWRNAKSLPDAESEDILARFGI